MDYRLLKAKFGLDSHAVGDRKEGMTLIGSVEERLVGHFGDISLPVFCFWQPDIHITM